MKNIFSLLIITFVFCAAQVKSQVQNVTVELYYISDINDATDTIDGSIRALPAGSKTYRVFIELKPGSRLKKIYGDANHPLKIISTQNFYNNIDRPAAYFGYQINKNWFPDNPLLALDSWLTLGLAEKTHAGILKANDSDGSLIGGTNNYGGTAGIAEGLLVNADSSAFVPFSAADGLAPYNTASLSQWIDYGFKDMNQTDTTVFGSVNNGSQFIGYDVYLQQNSGVIGPDADSTKVIVAQLTTLGEISFELNVVLIEPNGASTKEVKYVARLDSGETNSDTLKISPALTYPPVCGCTDPNYLEYSPAFACSSPDSCKTKIVFGCMDTAACNYSPNANFHIEELCCYPGFCNDRDIAVVCQQINNERQRAMRAQLFPSPADDLITLEIPGGVSSETKFTIYDSFGIKLLERNLGFSSSSQKEDIDVSSFGSGLYLLRLEVGKAGVTKKFIKN